MGNQSSRYRDNNERLRRMRNEKKRREKRPRVFMAGILCAAVIAIVFLGYLIFVNLFSDGQKKISDESENKSEAIQETEYDTDSESEAVASKIDQTSLEEIIASAQKKAETANAENNAEALEKLKQRIQEAKDLISENASEEKFGIAYLNLILAINEIE